MKVLDALSSANAEEAEMAATAYKCLVAALDHSKAQHIEVKVDLMLGGEDDVPTLRLPPKALRFLADVLRQMAKREPMVLMPHKHELTTQDAANLLNVSRPFIINEIKAGNLKCRLVGTHRRIEFDELRRYQAAQKAASEKALQDVVKMSEDLGLEF